MGSDKHEKERHKERLAPFVPLLIDTLKTPAWRALSHGARSLYVALKQRYNNKFHNNGRVFLSQRDAAKELNSHHNEIARWFRELRHYGFIVMTTPGALGVEGRGKAPRWRLTELGCMKELPTRDFMRWDGRPFQNTKTKSRAGIGARGVQGNPHTSVQENSTIDANSVQEKAHITKQQGVQENRHRTILPYTKATRPLPDASAAPAEDPLPQPKPKRARIRLLK